MSDADATTATRVGTETRPWDAGAWRAPGRDEGSWGLTTIAPVAALYLIAWILPMVFAVYASLYDIPLTSRDWEFIGLANYRTVLWMEAFWLSLWRGVIFATGSTLVQVGVGVWMALLINRIQEKDWPGKRIYATVAFTSFLVPTIVLVILTLFMFDLFVGLFQVVGAKWLGLWSYETYLPSHRGAAMPLLIAVNSWKYAGFVALFTLAQRRSVPRRYYEAARTYGATTWQAFRDVTVPRIRGIVALIALFRFVFTFNQYDIVRMLTAGGPGSETTTLPVLAYGVTFGLGEYGLGNALAVVMFLSLFVSSLVYFAVFRPSEEVRTNV